MSERLSRLHVGLQKVPIVICYSIVLLLDRGYIRCSRPVLFWAALLILDFAIRQKKVSAALILYAIRIFTKLENGVFDFNTPFSSLAKMQTQR